MMQEEYNARARQARMRIKDSSKAGNSRQWALRGGIMMWDYVEAVVAGLVELRGSGMEGRPRPPPRVLLRGTKGNFARSVAVYLARMCCA
jgi:hypothetical protein